MKKTMECLKKYKIIDNLQTNFDKIKPPEGTSEKTINEAIEGIIKLHMNLDDSFSDDMIDALLEDVVDLVRSELKIEYGTIESLRNSAVDTLISFLERMRG